MTAAQTVAAHRHGRIDLAIIGIVGVGHGLSHLQQLALAPLLPLLRGEFGVSYTLLGAVFGVFFAVSGISQSVIGALVDRHGARPVLAAGMALFAASVLGMGFAPNVYALFPLAVTAALGNSVFHPANLTILSNAVSESRIARGFAFHSFCGFLGFAVTPILVRFGAEQLGWRGALIAIGTFGLCYAGLILASPSLLDAVRNRQHRTPYGAIALQAILKLPSVQLSFLFFVLVSTAGTGVQTFAIPILHAIQNFALDGAVWILSCYLAGGAVGNLLGGFIAERFYHHERIVAFGLINASILIAVAAIAPVGFPVAACLFALGGISTGTTAAARDLLVLRASPPGATGRVFGAIYSGLDVGSALGPIILSVLADHGAPIAALMLISTLWLMAAALALVVDRRSEQEPSSERP